MNTITGTYTSADIFTDNIESSAKKQIEWICNNPVSEGSSIKVMPDVHSGKIGPIGLTMTFKDKVIPSLVGVDLGCGMLLVQFEAKNGLEFMQLNTVIREHVPAGFNKRNTIHRYAEEEGQSIIDSLYCKEFIDTRTALASLGTLGGGNHFIEVDRDDEGNNYLIIHSGSRHLGTSIAEYYTKKGYETLKLRGEELPYDVAYVDDGILSNYIEDVFTAQAYAYLNRRIIAEEILSNMKWKEVDRYSCIHNYVAPFEDRYILRKGAISAKEGEKVIIPINMRDGVILGTGKGCKEYNYSAPHGAGRLYSRKEAKSRFNLRMFKDSMKGIFSPSINMDTLDEAPFVYRGIDEIIGNIQDTVNINKIIKPLYNFKGGKE